MAKSFFLFFQDAFGWTNDFILDSLVAFCDRMTIRDTKQNITHPWFIRPCRSKAYRIDYIIIIFIVLLPPIFVSSIVNCYIRKLYIYIAHLTDRICLIKAFWTHLFQSIDIYLFLLIPASFSFSKCFFHPTAYHVGN